MSVHIIYYKDGAKMMRPIHTREEYMQLRNSGEQKQLVERIHGGENGLKHKLLQMNYSCLPNDDGTLKGSTHMSTTVGMDIDHLSPEEMPAVRDRILAKKDELGLGMLEESARGWGYHLVFARRPELSQEGNLKWASDLLNVAFDKQAKDITRVFFTTSADQLIYLDDSIFEIEEAPTLSSRLSEAHGEISRSPLGDVSTTLGMTGGEALGMTTTTLSSRLSEAHGEISRSPLGDFLDKPSGKAERSTTLDMTGGKSFPTSYHGIPFEQILKKYWEVNNQGYEPTEGDRDTLTYQLACDLRHICGKNADWLDQVIPCYDGFTPEEKREKIKNALSSEYNGFPQRLRNTLNLLAAENRTNRTDSAAADDEEKEVLES